MEDKKMSDKELKELHELKTLKELASPLVDYLRENHNPYMNIVVSCDYIKMFQEQCSMPCFKDNKEEQ